MEWPPIIVPVLGRSGLIALVALLHIPFFVNFVMGAPIIAVISEWLGKKTGDPRYDKLSKNLSVMVLVTVGVGAFGGIALVATNLGLFPTFFSSAVRIFFWPLLIEISFFLIETIFIAIYRYTYDQMAHRPLHMVYGLLGAFGAWMSGFLINGLASFMLTPGIWAETHNIFNAIFNPSFFASFTHRAIAAFSITGFFLIIYALWKHTRAKNDEEKEYGIWSLNYAGKWALIATAIQFLPGVWYLYSLEIGTRYAAPEGSVVPKFLGGEVFVFWFGGILLATLAILIAWFLAVQYPRRGVTVFGKLILITSVLMILSTNAFMGFSRERVRKPYLVYGLVYGNEMMSEMMKNAFAEQEAQQQQEISPTAQNQIIVETSTPPPPAAATGVVDPGFALFQQFSCIGCHTYNGQGGQVGPVLTEVGKRLTADEIKTLIQNPPAGMPLIAIPSEDMETLVNFLISPQ
jgi:cytochrome bd-type quinol oxidase subunit 1